MALAEIYKMMAKARIDAVLRFVPDEKTKADVASYLESEGPMDVNKDPGRFPDIKKP